MDLEIEKSVCLIYVPVQFIVELCDDSMPAPRRKPCRSRAAPAVSVKPHHTLQKNVFSVVSSARKSGAFANSA